MLWQALKSVDACEVEPERCAKATPTKQTSFVGSRKSLATNLSIASKGDLLKGNPHSSAIDDPICTSLFDLFKIGPGPSSSHTMGPMKAAFDFLQDLRLLLGDLDMLPDPSLKFRIEAHLHGSLSLTGRGHKTDTAIVGGLLGWLPQTCDPDALVALMTEPGQIYRVPVLTTDSKEDERRASSSDSPMLRKISSPTLTREPSFNPLSPVNHNSGNMTPSTDDSTPSTTAGATPLGKYLSTEASPQCKDTLPFFPIDKLSVGAENFFWHKPEEASVFPHPNTMILKLVDDTYKVWQESEYYSVGGGFIQKKGCRAEGEREGVKPVYPYRNMAEFKSILEAHPDKAWHDVMMENEVALTGCSVETINQKLDEIIEAMEAAVVRGINARGILPGTIGLHRKAALIYEKARKEAFKADSFLSFLNAYSQAASEENAAGRVVVTAPTSGSSGVFPGLIYFMKHHLFYPANVIREALLVGACIGFLVKRNASISGAEMGCMGEIGVAASMGAAMLTYAAGGDYLQCEAAAEIALEHHLGMTCDPVGGYVQIPCIQRNPMGSAKAYNAYLLAIASDPRLQKISLDCCIQVMRETGEDMSSKYKETSEAGLALNFTTC